MSLPRFSITLLILITLVSFFGSIFYDIDPTHFSSTSILLPPSIEHLMGTDRLGRDVLARVIEGGQTSLIIGFASSIIASIIGLMYGAYAGFKRGLFDKFFVLSIDLFLTFPTFFLLLALVSYVNASTLVLILIISLTGWMSTARLIRSKAFEISDKAYIKALVLAKVPNIKIIFKYYAPLLASIYLVSFTFGVGGAILAESGLSFLGLGIVEPQMSWGSILSNGKEVMDIAWWVSFFPGLMIFLITFSVMNISNYIQHNFDK